MALPPSTSQKSSRWGSFLSSVESRLDTILADDDPRAQNREAAKVSEQPVKKDGIVALAPRSQSPARTPSANRAQDRLNERLAKAMANKALGRKGEASGASSGIPSRTGSPANVMESPKSSLELQREAQPEGETDESQTTGGREQGFVNGIGKDEITQNRQDSSETTHELPEQATVDTNGVNKETTEQRPSTESHGSVSTTQSLEITRSNTPNVTDSPSINGVATADSILPGEYERNIGQLQADNEAAELRRQEEVHEYLERIDTLQAKLQYLTKEAAEIAKSASSGAKPGSLEQKMAVKDEKIALLIEEGQKLSQTELKHMTVIKKLRAKTLEDEKAMNEAKKALEKHERLAREAQERAKRIEAAEKRAADRVKHLVRLENDLESTTADRDSKDSLIRDLQFQLSEITSAAKEAEEKAQVEALEAEQQRVTELTDELSNVKAERDLAEKEHQNILRELREKSEREKERARVAEIERQGEQSILERRLEAYRARAEEASAGQGGNVQAKLLRQIETLQNQHSVASENWQGIEGSLLSRLTTMEKERDETSKREVDVRRKARELSIKAKRMEDELERAHSKIHELDSERTSLTTQLTSLQERSNRTEAAVNAARNDLKAERESWEIRQAQRLDEERFRIREEFMRSPSSNLYAQFRNESPVLQTRTRKSSNAADRSSPHSRRVSGLQGLAISCSSHPFGERPPSRRSSTQPIVPISTDFQPKPIERQDSMSTIPNISVNNGIPETPSIDYDSPQVGGDDDFFAGIHTSATPPERTINELVSVSTAGAGPSVQLVERMSATVRRLESEKAAYKDELARLGSQRDEAREQVVELMRDNEGKKAVDQRVKELEKDLKELKGMYDTTLEMLGEKSERVEELKADVVDLKAMMREMVEERVS